MRKRAFVIRNSSVYCTIQYLIFAAVQDLCRRKSAVSLEPPANRKTQSRGEARRRAMIEAAWQVLQEKGCEAATLNDIIAVSGGSRATLYEAFGGKDGLIEAAVAERCIAFGDSIQLVLDDERSEPRRALRSLAEAFLVKVYAPDSLCTLGIFVAEGARFPHMIETFIKHGPRQLTRR